MEWYEFTKEGYEKETEEGLDPKTKAIYKLLNQQVIMHCFVSEDNMRGEIERVKMHMNYNKEQSRIITEEL